MHVSIDWEESAFRARAVSTRAVRIAGENHETRFTREALEGMARQVRHRFVAITIEHLDYVPPMGRWHEAEVVQADDGEFELEMYGRPLRQLIPVSGDPPDPLDSIPRLPDQEPPRDLVPALRFEARNFDQSDLAAIKAAAPFPMREEHRWSELPPLIWTLSIPVVSGACKFAGAFFDTLGQETAEAVARWLRAAWGRSRDANRDRMLTLRFELDDGIFVYGFIASRHDDPDGETRLAGGLHAAALLAAFAGLQKERSVLPAMKRAAFIFADARWRLAWWTDGDSVYQTHWFQEHMPDPARFLGRPLMEGPQSTSDP